MAKTPTNLSFGPTYIGIGEDHVGGFAFDFNNNIHTEKLNELVKDIRFIKGQIYLPNQNHLIIFLIN